MYSIVFNALRGRSDSNIDDTDLYLISHYLNKTSQLYGYLLWAALLVSLLLSKIPLPTRWRQFASNSTRWRILRHRTIAHFGRGPQLSPEFLPTNGNMVLLTAFFALLSCLFVVGPNYIPGPSFKIGYTSMAPGSIIQKSLWTSAARAGVVAFSLLPLCVLLALRCSPLAIFTWKFTTQSYFDKLAVFHRWTAIFLYFFSAMHVTLWTIKLSTDRIGEDGRLAIQHAFQKNQFVCGWMAFGIFTILMIASTSTLRRSHYEAFYALHIFLFPIMLIMCAFHHSPTGWWAWLTLALWVTERVWRCGRILSLNYSRMSVFSKLTKYSRLESADPAPVPFNDTSKDEHFSTCVFDSRRALAYQPPPGYAHAELLCGATVRLTYTSSRSIQWAPGQHFLLNIPSLSRMSSHPFTCCSIYHEATAIKNQQQMVFLIRAKSGWTKDLWDSVIAHTVQGRIYIGREAPPPDVPLPSSGLVMKMGIDGPFGSSVGVPWEHYSGALIIVGGSGVAFGLSILEHLSGILASRKKRPADVDENTKLQRIRFVWLVRDFGQIQWCSSIIRRCKLLLPEEKLQIDIFVTKSDTNGPVTGLYSEPLDLESQPPKILPDLSRRNTLSSITSDEDIAYAAEDATSHGTHVIQGPGNWRTRSLFCSRDLTDFEGESHIDLPGEVLLSHRIKREGRVRRARTRKARRSFAVPARLERSQSPFREPRLSSDYDFDDDYGRPHSGESQQPLLGHVGLSPLAVPELSDRETFSHPSTDSSSHPRTSKSERNYHTKAGRSGGSRGRESWLPLHCAPPQPPQAFSYGDPTLSKATKGEEEAQRPVQIRLDERELKDISVVAENAKPGKPRLGRILQFELEEVSDSLMVTCCGPVSLNVLVRENIAMKMAEEARKQNGKSIAYYSEEFEY